MPNEVVARGTPRLLEYLAQMKVCDANFVVFLHCIFLIAFVFIETPTIRGVRRIGAKSS